MKLLSKSIIYVYVALWMMYYLQGTLMLKGGPAQVIFVFLIVISLYALIQVNLYYKTGPYLRWLNIMLLILSIYGIVTVLSGETFHKGGIVDNVSSNYFYLQRIYLSVLPIYAFYYFSLKQQLTAKNINSLFVFLLICSILLYYQRYESASIQYDKEEITNNLGYYFVPLIIMLYVVQLKEIWKYITVIVIFAFIMMSMKRGAIFAGTVALVSFMAFQLRKATRRQVLYIVGLIIAVLYVAYRLIINLYETSSYFRVRLDRTLEGDSSGRNSIYQHYLSYFTDKSTAWEFLFGHGASGTVRDLGQWAHNDWLEFAINHGILGLMLYLVYWCVMIYEWWNYHGDLEHRQALRDCIIVYFFISMYSMSFIGLPTAAALCIGYCMAHNVINQIPINNDL